MCDVLVLDDSPSCELIADSLRHEGFEVAAAHTPAEAFDVLRHPPGARVLVTDLDLNPRPREIGGFATAMEALRLYPSLRAVHISGNPEALGGVSSTPRERLLRKSLIPAELIGTVRDLLDETPSGRA